MLLDVQHLTSGYGTKQILTDISFSVEKGDTLLIRGGNGSGKSTLLKCIYGILSPCNNSKILFEQEEITNIPTAELLKKGIVYMPQKKNVFEDLTVLENILVAASLLPKATASKRIQKILATFPILQQYIKRTPFNMSGGEKQILSIALLLLHNPKLFLMDEPFAGVDDMNTKIIKNEIISLINQDVTFIIVEHKEDILHNIVNRIIDIELGTIKTINHDNTPSI